MKLVFHLLDVYWHLVQFAIKRTLEYRANAIVQSLYGIVYLIMLFSILKLIYANTPRLGDWTEGETMLMFGLFHSLYYLSSFFLFRVN